MHMYLIITLLACGDQGWRFGSAATKTISTWSNVFAASLLKYEEVDSYKYSLISSLCLVIISKSL